ncbi:MAG: two-component system response regulator [Proteobacteria bacterium]|nr:two-component system response regulator [Pseudomonadota bacterium]
MEGTTILIVDDSPTVLASMNKTLASSYRVRAANSGERAIEMVSTDPRPDLILLDVIMPGMDGYTVLSKLRENPDTHDIPVIFVTAMEAEEDEERGLELGAVDYITKPIRPAILMARVKSHLVLKCVNDFLNNKNAFLEAEISRRMEENQTIQNVSIRALAHLAEARDPETGEHIQRTQSYVRVLARHLQRHSRFSKLITESFATLLTRSAPLHDIGKVGIPDEILLKSGSLTESEWEVMKTHAELGANAIEYAENDVEQHVEFLSLAKEIAHWHHEKWDGSGYPDGLAGEAIPISARIMAIADVFDALITNRVYKTAISFDDVRDIIVAERGRHFDPDIVDVFIDSFDEYVAIARRFRSVSREYW